MYAYETSSQIFLRRGGNVNVLGGAENHIKVLKLHLLPDQRELLNKGP